MEHAALAAASSTSRHRSAAAADLRAATRREHAAVESLPLMEALMSAAVDAATYVEVLRRQLRIHAGWERAHATWLGRLPWPYRPRVPGLQADLARLRDEGADHAVTDAPAPCADDDATAWGMLYVVEGAALGGQFIARHLRSACPSVADALRHFEAGSAPDRHWPHFRALLDHHLAQAQARDRAIGGARRMFAHFHHHLAASRP